MNADKQRNMEAEWRSWEPILRGDVERLQHRIQMCYSAMSCFSVPKAEREAYVLPRILEMIRESEVKV